jgi:hypothetical protein
MSVQDYATIIMTGIAVLTGVYGLLRWLVKNWLNELKPNGGASLKDAVNRLDTQVKDQGKRIDDIYSMLYIHVRKEK